MIVELFAAIIAKTVDADIIAAEIASVKLLRFRR
jgi:hypothetical protein